MISSEQILAVVKRAISVPASQPLITDEVILGFADEIIASRIVPLIESFDTEFFLQKVEIPLVGGQNEYQIPYRSVARGLRDIVLLDSNTNTRSLPMLALEEINLYINSTSVAGFLFRNDKILLIPQVPQYSANEFLRVWYRLSPSKLINTSSCAVVTAINLNTGGFDQITVSSVPDWAVTGALADCVAKKSGSAILGFDKAIQNVSGNVIYFSADDIPLDLAVGDYITPAEFSPVLNSIPNEAIGLVRSHICYRVLTAIGDYDAAQIIFRQDIPAEQKDFASIMSPRIDGEPTIIINRRSLVRGNKFSQRRWLGPP